MQATIEGRLLKAERQENGNVKGALYDGSQAVDFYCKAGPLADQLIATFASGELPPVALFVDIFAGTDFDTKAPNGRLSVKATALAAA